MAASGAQSTSLSASFTAFDDAETMSPVRRRALFMIALGEFLDGYDLIAMAGALLQLTAQFKLTSAETGLLGASTFFGAAVGLVGAGAIADRIGRRMIFVHNFWLFAILSFVSAFITGFPELFAIRFLLGIAIGADIAISIPFLAEIAPRKSRGKWAGALPQIAWTSGAIMSLIVALLLINLLGDQAWRWLFGLGTIPALIIIAGRHGLPESPHWLLSKGRRAEAEEAMVAFGMPKLPELREVVATQAEVLLQDAPRHGSFLDIFRAPYTRRAWLVMAVLGLGPLVGTAAAVIGPYVFKTVGLLSPTAALGGSILIWFGGLTGSLIAWATVERIGRLRSSVIAAWGQACCLIGLVLTFQIPTLFVAFYVLYGGFVWFGSSSNWLLPTELLPAHLRARSQGIGSGLSRVSGGICTLAIPLGIANVSFGVTFGTMATIGIALGLIVMANLQFETKGKSLEI